MRIAFDLDDTLIPAMALFPVENVSWFARVFRPENLRRGTIGLFRELRRMKCEIWIYTTSTRTEKHVKFLFRLYGLKVDGVINREIHEKHVKFNISKYPPAFGIDILVDNSDGVRMESELHDFTAIIIDPYDDNWTAEVMNQIRLQIGN